MDTRAGQSERGHCFDWLVLLSASALVGVLAGTAIHHWIFPLPWWGWVLCPIVLPAALVGSFAVAAAVLVPLQDQRLGRSQDDEPE